MKSKEALKRLYDGYQNGMAGRSFYDIIKQDLERLEQLEKAQELEIENLKYNDNENKYQVAIRVLKEAFIVLGKSDITNTCWFKYLEKLEKENQELKDTNMKYAKLIDDFQAKNMRLEKAIKIIKTNRVDVPMFYEIVSTVDKKFACDRYNQETNEKMLTKKEYELLREVLENES